MQMKKSIEKINKLLAGHFGIPLRKKKLPDPVDLLIATILSQNTNDRNSYKAFINLKSKFPDWETVSSLPQRKIEQVIRIAGLGKQKSKAIKNLLSSLKIKRGRISLKYLYKMKNEDILEELTSYKGIGIKTASCVLLFSLDRNVCPVDTHVHRTLNKIGLVNTSVPEKTYYAINDYIPSGKAHQFHTNLIRLGREVCKPAKPNCTVCPLKSVCKYENKNFQVTNNYPSKSRMSHKQNSFMLLDEVR